MLAGRELDALVAEKVMGWKHSEAVEREWMHFPETGPFTDCECEGHMAAQICPHYSTEIGAAWQVVEKMHRAGWDVGVCADNGWGCTLTKIRVQGDEHFTVVSDESYGPINAPSAPLAICLAALKAVGYEPKETI